MKKVLIFLSFVVLLSCSNSVVSKPKNLIDEDKMVEIFYDLSLLEAVRTQIPQEKQVYKGLPNNYIYKKYKIDSLQFVKSNQYYASDITNYKKMYERVKEKLAADTEKLNPKPVIAKKK
jgi:Domain of unknown function (DUF4296)